MAKRLLGIILCVFMFYYGFNRAAQVLPILL